MDDGSPLAVIYWYTYDNHRQTRFSWLASGVPDDKPGRLSPLNRP